MAPTRPTLLLVHGFPLDHSLWQPQVAGLSGVARVIAPDLPGFGTSAAPRTTMSMDDYADGLRAALDTMGIARVVLGGLSMGGYVALAFVAKFPDVVQGLVLCNTRAGADGDQAREGRRASERTVEESGVGALAQQLLPKMLSDAATPELRERVRAMMAAQPAVGVVAALRGMAARPDRTALLPSIEAPTLVITGSGDTLIPASESEAMATAIPGARLVILPDVAHLSNLEAPDAFDAAVRGFLAGLP
jgi:pimeloyl-ACP methyl ester carboxylesterase